MAELLLSGPSTWGGAGASEERSSQLAASSIDGLMLTPLHRKPSSIRHDLLKARAYRTHTLREMETHPGKA